MDIEHLRYFISVANTQHITRSAEMLHISQPSLSKAISNVEAFVGTRLFDRDKSKIILNEEGKIFLRQLNLFFEVLEHAKDEIREYSALETGVVRIASSIGSGSLNDYLITLHKRYPNIRLTHQLKSERDMAHSLAMETLDIAVSTEPLHEYTGQIVSELILSEQMLVLVPKNHPLAGQETVPLEALSQERFVMTNGGMQMRDSILQYFRSAGIEPHIVFDSSSPDLVGAVLESGEYLSLIPASTHRRIVARRGSEQAPNHRVVLKLSTEGPTRRLYLNYLEDNSMSEAAKLVLQEIPQYFLKLQT